MLDGALRFGFGVEFGREGNRNTRHGPHLTTQLKRRLQGVAETGFKVNPEP